MTTLRKDGQPRKPTTGGVKLGSSYDEARTRKTEAEAEIAELTLEKLKGTLCETGDVVKAWENVLHACRAKLLAIPAKISPVVANEDDPAVIKDYIEGQIREALLELSNYNPSIDPVATGATTEPASDGDAGKAPPRKRGRPRKGEKV